nr:MAG: nonstructural protein [Riboviria sp.]WKV34456.1 MAG: RNA-dependent RNA polymerase [Riboviria sp.]
METTKATIKIDSVALTNLKSKIECARKHSKMFANVCKNSKHKPCDKVCFAVVLYDLNNTFEVEELRVQRIANDWDGSKPLFNDGTIIFTPRPSYSLKNIVKEVAAALEVCVNNIPDQDGFTYHVVNQFYPVILSLLNKGNVLHYASIRSYSELQILTTFEELFNDFLKLMRCGDVESNPGPFTPMAVEELVADSRQRFVCTPVVAVSREHLEYVFPVKPIARISDRKDQLIYFWSAVKSLNHRITQLPSIQTYIDFNPHASTSMAVCKVVPSKRDTKISVESRNGKRIAPQVVHVTPIAQAMKMLTQCRNRGVWTIPIYTPRGGTIRKRIYQQYVRTDGKSITIGVDIGMREMARYEYNRANIDDLPWIKEQFFSYCFSNIMDEIIVKAKISGRYDEILESTWMIFFNNALVKAALANHTSNSINFFAYIDFLDLPLCDFMDSRLWVTPIVKNLLKAPLTETAFQQWKSSTDLSNLFGTGTCMVSIRVHEYGLGAPRAYGIFKNYSPSEHFISYFSYYAAMDFGTKYPCSEQQFNNFCEALCALFMFRYSNPAVDRARIDYGEIHLLRAVYTYGIYDKPIESPLSRCGPILVCPACYTTFRYKECDPHCFNSANKSLVKFMNQWNIFESIFSYWTQLILGTSQPTWNPLFHYACNDSMSLAHDMLCAAVKPILATPTMDTRAEHPLGVRMLGLGSVLDGFTNIQTEVSSQLSSTSKLLNDLDKNDIVNRTASIIARIEDTLPVLEGDAPLSSYIDILDNWLRGKVFQAVQWIYPDFCLEDMPNIKFSLMLRDYIIARNVDNKIIKGMVLLDMFKQAGVYDVLVKFFTGFTNFSSATSKGTTSFSDVGQWLVDLLEKPKEWGSYVVTFISGFVSIMCDKFNPLHLMKYIANVAPSFRNFASIGAGVNALTSVFQIISRAYYLAKEYVCGVFGIKCNIPIFVHIKHHLANWTSAVNVLCMPNHRNTIIATPDTWDLVEDIRRVGVQILKHAPSGALSNLAVNAFKDLTKLKTQISWKIGMSASVFVPFVVHLNGPPNIGKSCAWRNFVPLLAKTMDIDDTVYMYNETTKWFDGYQQEEVIIVDDVNLSKDPEHVLWMIKLIAPNLCYLPTAENETRPLVSNCKLIILTSNTAYSPVLGLATADGIDRRSTYKFQMAAKHYDNKLGKVITADWSKEHTYERIPSMKDTELHDSDKFTGGSDEFLVYICKEARKHVLAEKARILLKDKPLRVINESEVLRECLMEGLSPGNDSVDLDVIRQQIKDIHLSSHEAFMDRLVLTTQVAPPSDLPELPADEIASITQSVALFRAGTQTLPQEPLAQLQSSRISNTYPAYVGNVIKFNAKMPDNLPDSDPTTLLLGKPFLYYQHRLDPYFLHHLQICDEGFYIESYYSRADFKHHFLKPARKTFDYHSYESLIIDQSFMDSHKLFFSLSDTARANLYVRWNTAVDTYTNIAKNHVSISKRIGRILSRLTSVDSLHRFSLGALTALLSIGAVGLAVEAMTSMLIHNELERRINAVTSNAPKPPKTQGTGVYSKLTSGPGPRDTGLINIKEKALRNLYWAKFCDFKGASLGVFNILFIHERFAIIPHHAIVGRQIQTVAEDNGLYCIWIYSDAHAQFLRYTFTRKSCYRLEGKDAYIIHIQHFRASASLLKSWSENMLSDDDIGLPIQTAYRDAHGLQTVHSNYRNTSSEVYTGTASHASCYRNQYNTTTSMPSGSSGGLAFIDSPKYQSKLIGIQSGTQKYNGAHIQAIVRQELIDAFTFINEANKTHYSTPTCDVPYEPIFHPEYPTLIGVVDKSNAVTVSPKTQIKNTPWHGKLVQLPERKPVFRTTERSDLYNYVNKNENTSLKPFCPIQLDEAVREYAEMLKTDLKRAYGSNFPIGILSLQAAVSGIYIGGKPMDVKASPGIGSGNWIKTREGPGQTDFIRLVDNVQFPTDKLKDAVTKLHVDCMHSTEIKSTYASFPKDELRGFLKDARGIDGAPIEQKVLYRMLFGRLDGLLSNINNGQLKYGLGINLFSPAGTTLISRMTDHVFAWDFSKFDGSITYQMYEAVVNLYNILSHYDEHCETRHRLAYITCHSTIIADDKVYQPNKGMRSGFGGTSSFNTHIHNLFIILAVKSLLKSKIMISPTIYDVMDSIDWITYGDDGLAWIKDPNLLDIVNGETIAMKFEEFGLKVADPRGKNSLPPKFIPITEATFLKQSPYFDETLLLPLWRVQEDCLESVFNYYSGDDPYVPLDSAFHMLWPYGCERYENIRTELNRIIEKDEHVYVRTWYQYLEGFRPDFEGVQYTGLSETFQSLYHGMIARADDDGWP